MKLTARVFIKNSYEKFQGDKIILYSLIINVVFIIFSFFVFAFRAERLPAQVPLFYSLPWGEERLARAYLLSLLPLSSFFISVFNLFFAAVFYEKEIFLARILAVSSALISFLSFYTLLRIVFLIT